MVLARKGDMRERPYRPERVADVPLTQELYESLKTAVAQSYPAQAQRNLLLLEVFRATGLRKSEVLRLQVRELGRDGPSYFLWVTRSKKRGAEKGLYEKVYIPDYLGARLAAYCLDRPPTEPMFLLKARMVNYVFQKATARMGVHVWPHQMRRLYYSWLRQKGMPSAIAASLLGDTEKVAEAHYQQALDDNMKRDIAQRIPT